MKNVFLAILMLLAFTSFSQTDETTAVMPSGWSDGSGGKIENLAHLRWLAITKEAWDEDWVQTNDIDATETKFWNLGNHDKDASTADVPMGFEPICWRSSSGTGFTGSYDGQGHSISNLFINMPETSSPVGLWYKTSDAEIRNIILSNVNITGYYSVGGLVGETDKGSISNCRVSGTITANSYAGGLVGKNVRASFTNCFSNTIITGGNTLGGIAGFSDYGNFNLCKGFGILIGNRYVGGVVGDFGRGEITVCEGQGHCYGSSEVGGLIGLASEATIKGCSSKATIQGTSDVGGLIGYSGNNTTITESSSYSNIYAYENGNGIGGLVGSVWSNGMISECNTAGIVSSPKSTNVGGLVGDLIGRDWVVKYCNTMGLVSGNKSVGGLIGYADVKQIKECYSVALVSGKETTGGLVGNLYVGTILNCFFAGIVGAEKEVGGITGYNSREIMNVFNAGLVEGYTYVGGVTGSHSYGSITNSFSRGIIKGDEKLGGISGWIGYGGGKFRNCFSSGAIISNQIPFSTPPFYVGGLFGGNAGELNCLFCFYDFLTTGVLMPVGKSENELLKSSLIDSSAITTEAFFNNGLGFPLGSDDENPWVIDKNGRPYFYWMKASVSNSGVDSVSSEIFVNVTNHNTSITETGVRYRKSFSNDWIMQPVGSSEGGFTAKITGTVKDSVYYVQGYAKDSSNSFYYGDMVRFKSIESTASVYHSLTLYPNDSLSFQQNISVSLKEGDYYSLPENPFHRIGFIFTGWNTMPDGSGVSYEDGSYFISGNSNTALYAQWKSDSGLGIDKYKISPKIKVYPNPAREMISIESNEFIGQAVIYNMRGMIVYDQSCSKKDELNVDVSNLSEGIYLVRLLIGGEYYSKKIVISNR
ncbi:MAG: T9SS type A sorting domain-containing protein [Prolixibacteraceae bacterium]|nr:T9SS type A sorting domain-containing protein [Prolixibacteraceae bacterium]